MHNKFTECKRYLQTFTVHEQVNQINKTIKSLVKRKHIANINDRRYGRTKELKHVKNLLLSKCNNESYRQHQIY